VSPRTLAHVTPEALRWARESAGYQVDDAAKRIRVAAHKLESAERGDLTLTLGQAERAADVYARDSSWEAACEQLSNAVIGALQLRAVLEFSPHPPHMTDIAGGR
jgi:ribosome-binding protein aMBF1 (putative translation factor)